MHHFWKRAAAAAIALVLIVSMLPAAALAAKPASKFTITVGQPQGEPMVTAAITEKEFRETYTAKRPDSVASTQFPTQTDVTGKLGDQLEGLQLAMYEYCPELSPEYPIMTVTFTQEQGYDVSEWADWWYEFIDLYAAPLLGYKYDYPENTSWTTHTIQASCSYSTSYIELSAEYIVSPYYDETYPTQMSAQMNAVLANAPATTRADKLKYIHDWLVNANEYDEVALDADEDSERFYLAHGPLGCMLKGTGVCESYAKAFKMFCNRLSIPCTIVTGDNHAWNYVMMEDGKWYMVDCTWDDPLPDGYLLYDYFLVSNNPNVYGHHEDYDFIYPSTEATAYTRQAPVNPFKDVSEGRYYYNNVMWAVENGIASGTGPDTFSPNVSCNRAQAMVFLWRANNSPEPMGTDGLPFEDVNPTDYYYKAVKWAVENGITSGVDATHFGSKKEVTRAQFVLFLYAAAGKPAVTGSVSFSDVTPGKYYYNAVVWAVENGITSGMGNNLFGVNEPVSRAQAVTFLHSAYAK